MQISEFKIHLVCRASFKTVRLGSDGNYKTQEVGEDVIEQGTVLQPQQAAELGSFSHVVLALE